MCGIYDWFVFCVYVKSDFCKFAAVYMLAKKKVSLIGNVILM